MYNRKIFDNKDLLLKNLIALNEVERKKYECIISQDFGQLKGLKIELEELSDTARQLAQEQKLLETDASVEWVFGELNEFVRSKSEPEYKNRDVFQRILEGIKEVIKVEMKELSKRKDRENYFALVAVEQHFNAKIIK
jgi:hypothetical protein